MGNKEYKTSEEVKQRAEEAIGHTFKEIFELARKYQQENGLKEKHGKGDIGQAYEAVSYTHLLGRGKQGRWLAHYEWQPHTD